MNTRIIRIDENNVDLKKIRLASKILINGGLVAFPTETVYGLGANGLDSNSVKNIFKAKGRPQDNPLILHVGEKSDLYKLVEEVPKNAHTLIDAFWPGPLTLILKKSKIIPKITTGGLNSVAVRMPANNIALTLIRESKIPIAAPSANISGRPSPTSAEHVIQDLYGKIDFIIDGGRTKVGVESTVIDLTEEPPVLLRPGGITIKEIENVIGKVILYSTTKSDEKNKDVVKSPGMKYRHYSPKAKLILVEGKNKQKDIQKIADKYKKNSLKVGIMTTDKDHKYKADIVRYVGNDFDSIAMNLFETLRKFDHDKVDIIIAQGIKDNGLGLAIMNRLRKAEGK